jgi:hypothetical protein
MKESGARKAEILSALWQQTHTIILKHKANHDQQLNGTCLLLVLTPAED